jgi:hypothetical protein
MVQIVWLVLLFVSKVFGVDTQPIAQLLSSIFTAMGMQ